MFGRSPTYGIRSYPTSPTILSTFRLSRTSSVSIAQILTVTARQNTHRSTAAHASSIQPQPIWSSPQPCMILSSYAHRLLYAIKQRHSIKVLYRIVDDHQYPHLRRWTSTLWWTSSSTHQHAQTDFFLASNSLFLHRLNNFTPHRSNTQINVSHVILVATVLFCKCHSDCVLAFHTPSSFTHFSFFFVFDSFSVGGGATRWKWSSSWSVISLTGNTSSFSLFLL